MNEYMKLSQMPKIVAKSKRRLGRGYGSGRAKTAGRGTKGQLARGRMPIGFEGGQLPLMHRLPLLRGKGRNPRGTQDAFPVHVASLEALPDSSVVTLELLKKHGMIKRDVTRVKILGIGKLTKKLTVALPLSHSAKRTVEQSGGMIKKE
jgi:large subunit ribosomal protein L15